MSTLQHDDVLNVLNVRRHHCHSLLELSRRQRGLIDSSDYGQLLTVLGQKQRLLGRLDELNQQHPNMQGQWKRLREMIGPELRDDCEHVLAETEAILADLLEEEQHSTVHLVQRRDTTQEQLRAVFQGGRVHQAYRESLAPATHRHLDVGQ